MSIPVPSSPLDPERVAELTDLFGGESEAVLELFEEFFQELDPRMETLREAIQSGRPDLLDTAAHAIKGSSANLGANGIRDLAALVEEMARSEHLDQVPDLVDRLEAELQRLQDWLATHDLTSL